MADEIPHQNVISVESRGPNLWAAKIGPDGRGLVELAPNPQSALFALFWRIRNGGWIFDPSWKRGPVTE